ncbi:PH domain-containing protein [uncultured Hyphomonas sp.]|uniref:PH domain-containing protein n=1 Tax=uncultured Hyphomonas sp. TaxID=225298 RepID=UPI002AAB7C0C|nr:PH domain-containing protein [uncultured Hyphomonas sp.]
MKPKIIRIYRNPVTLFLQVLSLLIISDIFFLFIVIFIDFSPKESFLITTLTAKEEFFFVILFLQFALTFHIFIQWMFNYYWFEDNLLMCHQGVFLTSTQQYILPEVEAATFSKSLLGRIFNFGTVRLVFANREYCLRRISYPEDFLRIINEVKNSHKRL